MFRCHSMVWNLYPTSCTFTGVLHGLIVIALYINHIYYNNPLCAFSSLCFIFSSPQYNNTSLVNVLSVFFSLVDLSLLYTYTWKVCNKLNVSISSTTSVWTGNYLGKDWIWSLWPDRHSVRMANVRSNHVRSNHGIA